MRESSKGQQGKKVVHMNQSPEAIETTSGLAALSGKMRIVILGVILVGLAVTLYKDALWDLATSVLHRENSSHGLCLPFISGYFIWMKSNRLGRNNYKFSILDKMIVKSKSCVDL